MDGLAYVLSDLSNFAEDPQIGLLSSIAAAAYIRSGRLAPLLVRPVVDRPGVFVYCSRTALPSQVRTFFDVAIELLADNLPHFLSRAELATTEDKRI